MELPSGECGADLDTERSRRVSILGADELRRDWDCARYDEEAISTVRTTHD